MSKCSLALALLASTAVSSAYAADVTSDRLLNANNEPQNWLMNHKDYSAHRFSELTQITKDNVGSLHLAFTTALGGLPGGGAYSMGGLQATPLVNDGAMYVVDGWGAVYMIDTSQAGRGRIGWIMDPGVNKADVHIPSNRGVSLYKDMVISVTDDGKVLWTKASTGELVKTVQVDTVNNHYGITTPGLVIGDKYIVGGAGGDAGARDHIDALNADTGAALWRTYSVPAPGEPGSESWKGNANNDWEHGGGAFWVTGSYDPQTNLTIWGTGNPVPMFDPEYRPGDNLFTNSAVAFDVDSGKINWYFQYTPGDFMDFDEVGSNLLVDLPINGETRRALAHFGRNGFYYTLDRDNGQFINGAQYVNKLTWSKGLDPKTGKPVEYDPSKELQTYALGSASRRAEGTIVTCPNIQGGVNYFPTSFSPKTGFAYGAGLEGCINLTADASRSGGKIAWNGGSTTMTDRLLGSITAVNPVTGKPAQQHMFDYASYSGVLSTAGGLVFTTTTDGTIYALDDTTLAPLWTFNAGTLSSAPPMTYSVDGKQYIAVLMGGIATVAATLSKSPELSNLQNTSMLYVFSL